MARRMIRRREVETITSLGRSSIYDLMSRGEFPRPIKLTSKAVAWSEEEIYEWLASRPKSGERI